MAMLVIANPHDVSYTLWVHSTIKVSIVLAAQVCLPLYELSFAIERIKRVDVATLNDINVWTVLTLLTVNIWMNKVMITKVDDALGANCYLLDRWYIEPQVVDPPTAKEKKTLVNLDILARRTVKHFWCSVSFGLKILMSFVINITALLAVAEFHGTSGDLQTVFVTIASLYVLMDLDMSAVIADGHMRERYRVYVCRLQEELPPTLLDSAPSCVGSRKVTGTKPSHWYVRIDAWYKYLMRTASLVAPLVILLMKLDVVDEP